MSSISTLSNSALQQGINQILSSTTAQDASGTSSAANTSSTIVSLGNGVAAPLTYNSRGQVNATQLAQLEQTVTASIDNTLSTLFSSPSPSGSPSTDSGLAALLTPASQQPMPSVTQTPSAMGTQQNSSGRI
ncbi:MAG: hypothetical protein M0T86_04145 [Betaproteobacteria bacterium]|nr:hypothetical protein [Betaproteobacteria bacterium]